MFKHNYGLEIEKVLRLMETERLDFDMFGGFISPARVAVIGSYKNGAPQWVDGDPIYPKHPDAVNIFGNFEGVSAVFSFDTDDKKVIEKFLAAVERNKTLEAA